MDLANRLLAAKTPPAPPGWFTLSGLEAWLTGPVLVILIIIAGLTIIHYARSSKRSKNLEISAHLVLGLIVIGVAGSAMAIAASSTGWLH